MSTPTTAPQPSYVPRDHNSPLTVPGEFVTAVAATAHNGSRTTIDEFVVPVRSGQAFAVPAGHVVRFSTIDGPQVLDANLWSLDDPRERFWASRTRQFYGAHVSVGHRLWSNLPFLRPLVTIVADTLAYGLDADHAGCHDLLGTRCDPYVNQLLSGTAYDYHCHSNLVRAVLPFGLTEFDVHDVINFFQVTGLMPDDERYFMKPCPARPGDYIELLAETDLLIGLSTCPGGDLAVPLWGPGAGAEPNCNPIGVRIDQLPETVLHDWQPSRRASYRGMHGQRHGLSALDAANIPLTAAITVEG